MSTTKNGIYYPNDYESVADIPADMKKMAESVDTKIAENETEIENIKTEQEKQNTNILKLQDDNTTNKQDITEIKAKNISQDEEIEIIKAKNTEQDKYISELEAENTRLREDLNGLPKGQASGESIDLSDSAEMRCDLKISGNSKQETRSGKNKLEFINGTYTDKNVTAVVKDGVITLNGKPSSTSFVVIDEDFNYTFKANQKYTISLNNSNIINSDEAKFRFSNGTTIIKDINFNSANKKETFYFTEDTLASNITIRTGTAITYNNFVIKPQLELEETASEWEQGGVSPSPDYPSEVESCGDNINIFDGELEQGTFDENGNIATSTNCIRSKNFQQVNGNKQYTISNDLNYQAVIQLYDKNKNFIKTLGNVSTFTTTTDTKYVKWRSSINNNENSLSVKYKLELGLVSTPYSPPNQGCINEVICNKNLAVIESGSLATATGMETVSSNYYRSKFIEVFNNKTFTASYNTNSSSKQVVIFEYDKDKNFLRFTFTNSSSHTTVVGDDTKYIRCRFAVDGTSSIITNVQIKEGLAETYEQHKEQVYTIPTQQPIRSIEIAKNTFLRDTFIKKNNKWYERHYIDRKIFDGNEGITINTKNTESTLFQLVCTDCFVPTNLDKIYAKSNQLKGTSVNLCIGEITGKNTVTLGHNTNRLWLRVSSEIVGTGTDTERLTQLKSWLEEKYNAGTPVYVDYVLAEPLDIECTEEQSTILFDIEQNAKTYDKVTHMYSTDNVSSYKEVTYKKDIDTMITNI